MAKKKAALHPRNPHGSYDFDQLIKAHPTLREHITVKYDHPTIDFSDTKAVRELNTALLKAHYNVQFWSIPDNYLCPGIPGRANYIHYLADLLGELRQGKPPRGRKIRVLDVGTGANVVYPIIGIKEYGWQFVGSEIDKTAAKCAMLIGQANPAMKKMFECRVQKRETAIFDGVIGKNDRFDLTLCNPPFHSSAKEAQRGTQRKLKNLGIKTKGQAPLNFGGQAKELWCEGGEKKFVETMIEESEKYSKQCLWFTTLVSKKALLGPLGKSLSRIKVAKQRVIDMSHGQRQSRFLAWTFFSPGEQSEWSLRWTK